jgi:hypothetical protein
MSEELRALIEARRLLDQAIAKLAAKESGEQKSESAGMCEQGLKFVTYGAG